MPAFEMNPKPKRAYKARTTGTNIAKPHNQVSIEFGALCPKIKDQLKAQGLKVSDPVQLATLQKCADACTLLKVQGLCNQISAKQIRQNIVRKVLKLAVPIK